MTLRSGVVVEWRDARGFGFIAPADGGQQVFVHATDLPRGQRPAIGQHVRFADGRDGRGRPRAVGVSFVGGEVQRVAPRTSGGAGAVGAIVVATAYGVALALLVELDRLPVAVLAAVGVVSGVAFLMYRADKLAAQRGAWRAAESTLLVTGLLGGWPGALVARHLYRHKTRKQPFRVLFWCTVVAHVAAVAAYALR